MYVYIHIHTYKNLREIKTNQKRIIESIYKEEFRHFVFKKKWK